MSEENSAVKAPEVPVSAAGVVGSGKDAVSAQGAMPQGAMSPPAPASIPDKTIPYTRMKEVIDERNQLKAKLQEVERFRTTAQDIMDSIAGDQEALNFLTARLQRGNTSVQPQGSPMGFPAASNPSSEIESLRQELGRLKAEMDARTVREQFGLGDDETALIYDTAMKRGVSMQEAYFIVEGPKLLEKAKGGSTAPSAQTTSPQAQPPYLGAPGIVVPPSAGTPQEPQTLDSLVLSKLKEEYARNANRYTATRPPGQGTNR